jgi:hypothetical protein
VSGRLLLLVAGLAMLAWMVNLARVGRLYAGYAIIFIAGLLGFVTLAFVPGLTATVAVHLEALFPGLGVLVPALGAVFLLFVYVLTQVTILSNRVAALVQELAIERARASRGAHAEPPASDLESRP